MSYQLISVQRDTGNPRIVLVTLRRATVKNAINKAMVTELHSAFDNLRDDADIGCVVLTGDGDDFAAGADIAELRARGAQESLAAINSALFAKIETFPVPVIAAIKGYALGGGCELSLACDIRVGGTSAQMGQPEVNLGIIPAAGGTQRLPRIVGLGRAKELVLTGMIIGATEAHRIGLLNRVVPDEQLMEEALKLAGTICKKGPFAIRMAKQALNQSARTGMDNGLAFESTAQALLFESEDKKQRMTDFLERKKK
ncbi:MAG: enoyl-CoA hydratase/isomerase family protein [Planctomycetes bacterium]|nr:enoyl-CoA hydratase/isomerase family protein [Planctomycetota bacterium]MCW8135041.1 enoyl-CoA hydratase/isomerase family protein [Planctomycetota bacterium]